MRLNYLIFTFIITGILFSEKIISKNQHDTLLISHSNLLKMRILAPIWNLTIGQEIPAQFIGIEYERVINKNTTLNSMIDVRKRMYEIQYSRDNSYKTHQEYLIAFYPEYRVYPFNKKIVYPQGFHLGPSLVFTFIKGKLSDHHWNGSLNYSKNYTGAFGGCGIIMGWQYFAGRRNRLVFDLSFGMHSVFGNYENPVIDVLGSIPLKGFIGWYLGYSFGKVK